MNGDDRVKHQPVRVKRQDVFQIKQTKQARCSCYEQNGAANSSHQGEE
jgi:hypothetical protein